MPPSSPPPSSIGLEGLPFEEGVALGLPFAASGSAMAPPPPSRTLADWLRSEVRMPPRDAARVVAELAERLQKIHDDCQFHRPITTKAVLLDKGLHPTFADDFVTAANEVDCASDVQALGAILYELITGHSPIHWAALGGHLAPTRPREIDPSIPEEMEAIWLKAMAKDPSSRYATARELAQALRQFLKLRRKPFWK